MRSARLLAGATVALCAGLLSAASASAYILFGDGYVPEALDTYVPADAGACCFGEYHSLTNVYMAQTFKATGTKPVSLTLGLANN